MERNAILATALVIVILLGYQWYLSRYELPPQETQPPTPSSAPSQIQTGPAPPPTVKAPAAPAKATTAPRGFTPTAELGLSEKDVVVETPLMRVVLSTMGARATSWQLKRYDLASGSPVDLIAIRDPGAGPAPLETWIDGREVPGVFRVDQDHLNLTGEESGTLTFTQVNGSGVETQKRLTFRANRYRVVVGVVVRNLSSGDLAVQPRLAWGPGLRNSTDKKASTLHPPTLWLDGKRVQEDLTKVNGEKTLDGKVSWAALQDSYFAAALLPKENALHAYVMKGREDQPIVGLTTAKQTLPPGGQVALEAEVFAGPKDIDVLKAAGQDLDKLVDLGWFDFLARPALYLLKFLYGFIGNYGLAIILVTVLQKVAFYPLTQKSLKSMQAMQMIQPKVQALQERYKNNPQKKQEETMALYRKHGVNPMGGCLPMIVQIPIFIALYNALSNSVEMWQAHFLWIRDLTQPDSLFKLQLWGGEYYNVGNILGLLMGVSMWVQQKMSPPAGDPRQAQMMLWMMPILFTWMFWSFPSGLVLYWLVNNILQIGQQWLIMGRQTRPTPTEGQAA
ncbi:MAG TPA: membrane protein insertase YidC [Candidatus Methylomirabilis sp.]|nr:membrane protein insertase YidC [Candidatus Methylomirabilis sp.]